MFAISVQSTATETRRHDVPPENTQIKDASAQIMMAETSCTTLGQLAAGDAVVADGVYQWRELLQPFVVMSVFDQTGASTSWAGTRLS